MQSISCPFVRTNRATTNAWGEAEQPIMSNRDNQPVLPLGLPPLLCFASVSGRVCRGGRELAVQSRQAAKPQNKPRLPAGASLASSCHPFQLLLCCSAAPAGLSDSEKTLARFAHIWPWGCYAPLSCTGWDHSSSCPFIRPSPAFVLHA